MLFNSIDKSAASLLYYNATDIRLHAQIHIYATHTVKPELRHEQPTGINKPYKILEKCVCLKVKATTQSTSSFPFFHPQSTRFKYLVNSHKALLSASYLKCHSTRIETGEQTTDERHIASPNRKMEETRKKKWKKILQIADRMETRVRAIWAFSVILMQHEIILIQTDHIKPLLANSVLMLRHKIEMSSGLKSMF